jgi:type II secretory pathway component PulC
MSKNKFEICFILAFCILVFGRVVIADAQNEYKYDAQLKRNPFIPLVTPDGRLIQLESEKTSSGLSLEGIIYDANGVSYALINGEVTKIGDAVGDYQVLKVEKDKVVLIKDGQPFEIVIKKEEE